MMKKMYWIVILFGFIVITGGTLLVKMMVDYYNETGDVYALGSVVIIVYTIGVMVGIVSNSLFQEIVSWIRNYLKKRMKK